MVELDSEGELARSEVAKYLRKFADELDDETDEGALRGSGGGGAEGVSAEPTHGHKRMTIVVGGESATVTVPERVMFDVEVESRSPMLSSGVNQDIELTLSWEIENPDERVEDWIDVE